MPHIIVKLWPGNTEAQKQELTERIARDVMEVTGCSERSVSVAIIEVAPQDWGEQVYRPDIAGAAEHITKQPGYPPPE